MHITPKQPQSAADPSWRIGILHSAWYPEVVLPMVDDAKKTLIDADIPVENITLHACTGSFEIPLIGSALAESGSVDALIALGVIVKGQTHHADLIAAEVARGVMQVQLQHQIPFAFEVLYVDSLELAKQRTDKGRAAAHTTLQSLKQLQGIVQ
jgi:6,7-dimethyl-8-ribityllumazine synthase